METSTPKQWSSSDISDTPHMEPAGIELLKRKMTDCNVFLEYGAGGSTILAAKQGVHSIFSVESDLGFIDAVSKKLAETKNVDPLFSPVFVDIGPTGNWGVPTDKTMAVRWPRYCVDVWDELRLADASPDLVLVDGRFRVACFLASLIFAKEGCTILFDDYVDRPQYHMVENFLRPASIAGRMAEFVVPANAATNKAIIELVKAATRVE